MLIVKFFYRKFLFANNNTLFRVRKKIWKKCGPYLVKESSLIQITVCIWNLIYLCMRLGNRIINRSCGPSLRSGCIRPLGIWALVLPMTQFSHSQSSCQNLWGPKSDLLVATYTHFPNGCRDWDYQTQQRTWLEQPGGDSCHTPQLSYTDAKSHSNISDVGLSRDVRF